MDNKQIHVAPWAQQQHLCNCSHGKKGATKVLHCRFKNQELEFCLSDLFSGHSGAHTCSVRHSLGWSWIIVVRGAEERPCRCLHNNLPQIQMYSPEGIVQPLWLIKRLKPTKPPKHRKLLYIHYHKKNRLSMSNWFHMYHSDCDFMVINTCNMPRSCLINQSMDSCKTFVVLYAKARDFRRSEW